ncbi:trypsin-like peptidase domain-containing protein [Ottowia sp.]|uniref:trypsin-like serine peptidase n=1 Tax=Ottowia sp. TaxID=1898956 RepID=UPI0025E5672C|nr:trypsin-like peptidase domain-containing protein [Ottowia sp.]
MSHSHALWTAIAASLILSACGGGSDTPTPPPPVPPPPAVGDRIEPLDTATLAKVTTAMPAATAVSRWPADAVVPQVVLEPLAPAKLSASAGKSAPLQIGVGRTVAATAAAADLAARLHWQRLPDGSQVAALAFVSPGAQALRLGVRVDQAPAGTRLRFYGAAGTPVVEQAAVAPQTKQGAEGAASLLWGPDTPGAVGTLELQLPPGASPAQLQLAVPELSHLNQTVAQALAARKDEDDIGDAGSCNLDVMCTPVLDAESRSVAQLLFAKDGDSYLCTGTLMNDTRGSRTPRLLTAAHCIGDADSAASLITYWFFRAASCNSSPKVDPAATRVTGGAKLLFTDSGVDSTLLQLNSAPPANVVFAGSYFGDDVGVGAGVVGIHHPEGDLQKDSLGAIAGYANCGADSCSGASADSGSMWEIGWTQGTTEHGSSGSAIWTQLGSTRYVVGALHGGSASCQNRGGTDFYGRFNRAFYRGLGNWLTQ